MKKQKKTMSDQNRMTPSDPSDASRRPDPIRHDREYVDQTTFEYLSFLSSQFSEVKKDTGMRFGFVSGLGRVAVIPCFAPVDFCTNDCSAEFMLDRRCGVAAVARFVAFAGISDVAAAASPSLWTKDAFDMATSS